MTEFERADEEPSAGAGPGVWLRDELAGLTDDELGEFVRMWSDRYEATRLVAGQGQRAWWLSKMVAAGDAEARRRSNPTAPPS